jgi:hypothetical protein
VKRPIDKTHIEGIVRERLAQEGRSEEEIESAIRELQTASYGQLRAFVRPRWEYKSEMKFLGLPLVHIVMGRDPKTGAVGKAVGIIAIGRMAFGVLALGQLAVGVVPIGQLAIGLLFALGQGAFAGYHAIGQVAVASGFAAGQFAVAASAIGQLALGRYVLAQVGFGRFVWSTKVKDPEALAHFKDMFDWFFELFS